MNPPKNFAQLIAPVSRSSRHTPRQCERVYSNAASSRSSRTAPAAASRLDPRMAGVWNARHRHRFAREQSRDGLGPDAMLDTVRCSAAWARRSSARPQDAEEARAPAIVEKNGVKIAILAYCSVLRDGRRGQGQGGRRVDARSHALRPGGIQPARRRASSPSARRGLEALQADIPQAKQNADVVLVTIHWGLRLIAKTICTYQPPIAHAAIDAGADLIIGHHAHSIKAVESYKGKICFYSIGNFMTTGRAQDAAGHLRLEPVLAPDRA
jgi:hypothetical protein